MYDDMSYTMLHDMMKKKFNLEANDRINLSVKLPSFDSIMEITDNDEVKFFVQYESNDAQTNEFGHVNDPNFTKQESSFAFGSDDENENEQNDCFDGVDENENEQNEQNPQPVYHKWKKFMSFKPDIPETPLYNSKPMISKHYKKDSEVKIGNTFDNKEALDLAVRLKALEEAWRGKEYGLQQIRGSPYESFEMLPYYCYNLERKNQGTVTRIKTDDKGVFEMLFIALGASIRTFLNYLRPLLIIDAAHLKGEYKGTNLVAVGMDGNNQIVPVAFGICKGETGRTLAMNPSPSIPFVLLKNPSQPLMLLRNLQDCQGGKFSRLHVIVRKGVGKVLMGFFVDWIKALRPTREAWGCVIWAGNKWEEE
ncbi:hypothetical protein Tco_0970980 [Tanacetum coccineum]